MAVSPPSSDLSISFVDAGGTPHALLDAGSISWRGRTDSSITTRRFAVRIGRPSREARGTATLRAFLETPDPHATFRIDGIVLATTPRVIQRHVPIGVAITHTLQIEVPRHAPEGALATSIGWEVTTD